MRVARNLAGMGILALAVFALGPSPSKMLSARLVSVQALPDGALCAWQPGAPGVPSDSSMALLYRERAQQAGLVAALQQRLQQGLQQRNLFAAVQQGRASAVLDPLVEVARSPVRTIQDPYPVYTAVAVNLQTDEVILQDINMWSTRVFDRLDDTPASAQFLEPKRMIQGPETLLQTNNHLYIDPQNGDIYSAESDTGDKMTVFSYDARGNVRPKRVLETPHRMYNITVNEERQEIYMTRQYPGEVLVYRKEASGTEKPLRILQGDKTGLEAPQGLVVDVKNQLLFVNNWGLADQPALPGTGHFNPPSIKVYPLDVSGNTPPVRVIQGDRTRLNWPGAMALNPDTGDLYVANNVDQSVLVFSGAANLDGNVPPARVIKGDRTRLRNPHGVFIDTRHQELWVANLGNASATVYPLMANGDVAPLRTIRSAPRGYQSLTLGKSQALAYDSTRQQILSPN